MADLSKLSTEDLIALKEGDLSKLSTEGLKLLRTSAVVEKPDPTEGMNWAEKVAAGAGKAVADLGLGARQIGAHVADYISPREKTLSGLVTGNDQSRVAEIQSEIDEANRLDAPLMNTGAGMAGNIAGNVGMAVLPGLGLAGVGKAAGVPALQAAGKYLLASPATLGGAATQGLMGATQSFLQPVATGESRAVNTAIGGAGGAAVPMAGMALKGAGAALEPLYEGGRQRIIGRALRRATGDNADTVIQNLRASGTLVPGSAPTAAEVADSGGIAAMQRAAAAVDPEAYATRAAQQNEARVAALSGMTGTSASRKAADKAREAAAGPLYRQAINQGPDPMMAQVLEPQIKNLMERLPKSGMHGTVLDKAKELARLNGDVMNDANSIKGLHWVKLAVDDLLSSGKQTGLGKEMTRGLMQFKSDLLTVLDDLSPDYAKARAVYQQLSKPIDQMDVASEIADKSVNKLTGILQPQSFARALSDDTAARATGFNKATLANTMTPAQLDAFYAIKKDLARSVKARDMGRGPGSDTVQKLAMTNLMQQSGLPVGLLNVPGLGRAGNWAYAQADDRMKIALALSLLDPQATANVMEKAAPSPQVAMVAEALRRTLGPAAIGSTASMSDAR